MRWLDGIIDNGRESKETPGDSQGQEAWRAAIHGATKSRTQLTD